jgi:uncharacterized SAM-dependent methyltransferase
MSTIKLIFMSTYFKNTELAARYNISEATVRNWVKTAKDGKLQLDLVEHEGRTYVTKSSSNIPLIETLVKQNRKYRNSLAVKTVEPNREFFKIFSAAQTYDIIRNLELHHEIPRQYGYFDEGAKAWDEYTSKQATANTPSMLKRTTELLAANYSYIDKRLSRFRKVNVVDIGVGNALPIKDLLAHLISQGKLGRYVALDFSDDMLAIAKRNLETWYGDRIEFEGYQLDIAHERFANIIAEDYLRSERDTVNLVLFLGATPTNLRVPDDAFRTICESMNPQDVMIYTDKLELLNEPPEWLEHSYVVKPQKPELLDRHKVILDQLNIRESFYEPEVGFDVSTSQRYSRARLKFALTLKFDLEEGERVVSLEKGDALTVWRCWRTTAHGLESLLENNGFYILHSSQSEDRSYILNIAEVRRS